MWFDQQRLVVMILHKAGFLVQRETGLGTLPSSFLTFFLISYFLEFHFRVPSSLLSTFASCQKSRLHEMGEGKCNHERKIRRRRERSNFFPWAKSSAKKIWKTWKMVSSTSVFLSLAYKKETWGKNFFAFFNSKTFLFHFFFILDMDRNQRWKPSLHV